MKIKPPSIFLISTLILIVLSSSQCKKTVDELSKLPAVTQEGKGTFGCLVNGKAWIPETGDIIIADPAMKFVYENTNGGLFYMTAKKSIVSRNIDEEINIAIDSCTSEKKYIFDNSPAHTLRFAFTNYKQDQCRTLFSKESDVITLGFVSITRFDLNEGVISGTFEFTLSKSGCKTIQITNGRFDAKL